MTLNNKMIDRIKCIVFRQAHDVGTIFINRRTKFIAELDLSERNGKNHIGNASLIIQLKFLFIITFVENEKKKSIFIEQLKLRVTQENHLVFSILVLFSNR